MTAPTRDMILAAHAALTELGRWAVAHYERTGDRSRLHQVDTVLGGMMPKPPETMADYEWDDDKHALAEAVHPDYGKVIMLKVLHDGEIKCLTTETPSMFFLHVQPSRLTPTGRRYTRTEVQDD